MCSLSLMHFVGLTKTLSAKMLVLKEEERNIGQPQVCKASIESLVRE